MNLAVVDICCVSGCHVAHQFSVVQHDYTVGETFSQRAFMGNHDNGHAQRGLKFAQQQKNLLTVDAVQISRGFVGEKNRWPVDQRACQCAPLLFAAREFAGAVFAARAKTHTVESFTDAGTALAAIDFRKAQREFDIFLQGHARQEIKGLKNHADGFTAVAREIFRAELGEIFIANPDTAGSRAVKSGEHAEQRGFTGTGAAQQGQKFAGGNGESDSGDGANHRFTEAVIAADVFSLNGSFGSGDSPSANGRGFRSWVRRIDVVHRVSRVHRETGIHWVATYDTPQGRPDFRWDEWRSGVVGRTGRLPFCGTVGF